jgi:hypothetical protein
MKKSLLVLTLVLGTLVSNSQIQIDKSNVIKTEIGKVKIGAYFHASLLSYVENTDTLYALMYSNKSYQHITDIKTISFQPDGNTLNQFYDILKSVFLSENKQNKDYKIKFQLGSKSVEVSNYRQLGITSAMLYCYDDQSYIWFTENQIEKLFNK